MNGNLTKPFTIVWWNTSLSPLGKSRATANDKTFAIQCITEFFNSLEVDLLALGEVCMQDIHDILKEIKNPNLFYHDATKPLGHNQFDIAVIFNHARLSIVDSGSTLDLYGNTTLKTGERLTLRLSESEQPIHIFVSHWPSRMYSQETSPKRSEMGTSLRKSLDKIRSSSPTLPFIVLMGDYNDDPYSPSLASHLLATRDREFARNNASFLYNPFWRQIGESEPFRGGQTQQGVCGTYFYKSGTHTKWHTFDQIIFSSAFLQNNTFILNETLTQIMRSQELERRVKDSNEIFDHLPVLSVIDIRRSISE